jgi:hypothetical protein
MLLTITTRHPDATALGYVLHKHPGKVQAFDLSFGRAVVFYPDASAGCERAACESSVRWRCGSSRSGLRRWSAS